MNAPKELLIRFSKYLTKQRNASPSTLRYYLDSLNLLYQHADFIQFKIAAEVDNLIVQVGESRKGKYADEWNINTMAKVAAICSVYFQFLIREGIIDQNPYQFGHGFRKKRPPEANWIRPEDLPYILYNPKYSFQEIVMQIVLRDTGMRISELENLSINDVHLEEGIIDIRIAKCDKPRRVSISEEGKIWLSIYLDMLRIHTDSLPDQLLFTGDAWQKSTNGALKKMGSSGK